MLITNKESSNVVDIFGRIPCVVKLPVEQHINEHVMFQNMDWTYSWNTAGFSMESFSKEEAPLVIVDSTYMRLVDFDRDMPDNFKNPYQNLDYRKGFNGIVDKKNRFRLLAAVAILFVYNENKLNGRPAPKSFEELCDEKWKDSIVCFNDLDLLYNTMVNNLEAKYGEDKARGFLNNIAKEMHPSEMLERGKNNLEEAVFVMPLFFARLKENEEGMKVVWPEDGAIASPIYISAKDRSALSEEEVKKLEEITQFLITPKFSELFSSNDAFPAFSPEVKNEMPGKMMWLSEDYLDSKVFNERTERFKGWKNK